MTEEDEKASLVRRVLMNDAPTIRTQFAAVIGPHLEEFIPALAAAFHASGTFDSYAKGDSDRELVASMIFSAVNGHLIAMRLFLDGFLVHSGNAQRQVLESIALAILCSKPEKQFLKRFLNDEYSSTKAIRDVIRNASDFGASKKSIRAIKKGRDFYDDFSHPSKMTIVLYSFLSEPDKTYIGGMYDEAKLKQYRIEATSRVQIAKILPDFVAGVRRNLEESSQANKS